MNLSSTFSGAPNWETKSAMRTYVFPTAEFELESGHYFAPHLIAPLRYLTEEEQNCLNVQSLEKQALFRYLANTEAIEIDLVNPSLLFIMEGNYEKALHMEAYRIYADEGFHAAMCVGLRESIGETAVGRPDSSRYRSEPLARLLLRLDSTSPRTKQLRMFFAAAINETLITQSLLQAKDPSLKPSIRDLISFHAMDEAQHHKYFSFMIGVIWGEMDDSERQDIASLLPDMLTLLLATDEQAIKEDLIGLGISPLRADTIVEQVVNEVAILERIKAGARGSLIALSRSGMFDCQHVQSAFAESGLSSLLEDRK